MLKMAGGKNALPLPYIIPITHRHRCVCLQASDKSGTKGLLKCLSALFSPMFNEILMVSNRTSIISGLICLEYGSSSKRRAVLCRGDVTATS